MILRGVLQEHRHTREAWAVATLLLSADPEVQEGDAAGGAPYEATAGGVVTCVGDRLGLAAPEEGLELAGEWERDKRGGIQFRVRLQASTGIAGAPQAQRWLERLDGVGPVLAARIFERFGSELVEVLSGESWADLAEINGISPERARLILESFKEIGQSGDLVELQYLDGLGCSRWEAGQVLRFAKARRLTCSELMTSSPYDLLGAKGLGWAKVDKLARFAGCPPDAPARLEAGSMHVLDEQVQEGSTMIRLGHLMRASCEALGVEGDLVHAALIRCAGAGRIVLAEEEGVTWVHPADLYRAERAIYKAAKAGAEPKKAPATRGVSVQAAVRADLAALEEIARAENEKRLLAAIDGGLTTQRLEFEKGEGRDWRELLEKRSAELKAQAQALSIAAAIDETPEGPPMPSLAAEREVRHGPRLPAARATETVAELVNAVEQRAGLLLPAPLGQKPGQRQDLPSLEEALAALPEGFTVEDTLAAAESCCPGEWE